MKTRKSNRECIELKSESVPAIDWYIDMKYRESILLSIFLIVSLLLFSGCTSKGVQPQINMIFPQSPMIDGELAIYQLDCPAFMDLSHEQKLYAYHLSRAAIAGRDIVYDQLIPKGLEIRMILDKLLSQKESLNHLFVEDLTNYARRFYAYNGNYDPETRKKILPGFSYNQLLKALETIRANNPDVVGESEMAVLKPFIFDPEFLPVLVNKNPEGHSDPISASSVNLYDAGISKSEVDDYLRDLTKKNGNGLIYTLNGRFAGSKEHLVEEVYRTGTPDIPPGRMAVTLEKVILELEKALNFAPDEERESLELLISYYRTGDVETFISHQRNWVKNTSSPVDYIFGFIETYDDPLGIRGTYESMIFIEDKEISHIMSTLAENAEWFEEKMPWNDEYKKVNFTLPSAKAFQVLTATGGGGPQCPVGINLPNFQELRENVGSKNFLLTNTMKTGSKDKAEKYFSEFMYSQADRDLALQDYDERRRIMIALHEVTGHGSGKTDENLRGDPADHLKQYASTLEETRANLAALWFVGDSILKDFGVAGSHLSREAAYLASFTWSLIGLRDIPHGSTIEEDHARGNWLILNKVLLGGGAELILENNLHYIKIIDVDRIHDSIGELLSEIQRIKATGDFNAAADLVESHGVRFDKNLRDEIVKRADKLNLPSRRAFIMPEIIPEHNRMGGIKNLYLSYPDNFISQMLNYADQL